MAVLLGGTVVAVLVAREKRGKMRKLTRLYHVIRLVLLCTCAHTLVHVPGTKKKIRIIHAFQRQTAATAVVVLQLLALSAAACLTLYTAV